MNTRQTPRRGLRRSAAAAGILVAAAVFLLLTRPPPPVALDAFAWRAPGVTVPGAFHVHTSRSDGGGSVSAVAAAAARTGLGFVVLTDHGDGTRRTEPPAYHSGVLCIDGVEISTAAGHYIALGATRSSYPLGGEPAAVVEDVARLGGFGVVAHPHSPRHELRWDARAPSVAGIEWLNGDTEWRDEPLRVLLRLPFDYLSRRERGLASLLDRPTETLSWWDALLEGRRVVTIAGADAHGLAPGVRRVSGDAPSTLFGLPSYESSFRTFTVRAVLDVPLSGDATTDADRVLHAIRGGRTFTSIDGLGGPARFAFEARAPGATARMGEGLTSVEPVRLEARALAPAGAELLLLRNGVMVQTAVAPSLAYVGGSEPAVYRVEVRVPGAPGTPPIPWIVSNPIFVNRPDRATVPATPPPARARLPIFTGDTTPFTVETDARSRAALDSRAGTKGRELAFRYALAGPPPSGQFAAFAHFLNGGQGTAGHDRLSFRARADRPMRLSVQVRLPGGSEGERWHHSVYLDSEPREYTLFLRTFSPVRPSANGPPDLARALSLILVVDTVNTRPGTSGVVWMDDLRLER
ncbi:MAG: CehA/McbA family metallohydrolase [Acidobacteria bacterium]|nr:CehA/McbA family metallohydrolase [Acidobacteriota bacterium]